MSPFELHGTGECRTSLSSRGASTNDPATPTLRDHLFSGIFVTKEHAAGICREYLVPFFDGGCHPQFSQLAVHHPSLRTVCNGLPIGYYTCVRNHLGTVSRPDMCREIQDEDVRCRDPQDSSRRLPPWP